MIDPFFLSLCPIVGYTSTMHERHDPYDILVWHYDAMHEALTEDIGMVLSLAARGGPVLELGCGTGRLLLPLGRAGHDVVGVDRSQPMLSGAHKLLATEPQAVRRHVQLLCADMTQLPLMRGRFGLALTSYNTFMHLNASQALLALDSVAERLKPGGLLFIDVANPMAVEETEGSQLTLERVLHDKAREELVVVSAANALDTGRQVLTITWIFDRSMRTGGVVYRSVVDVNYHYYFPHQFELMLAESGLSLLAMYGGYHQQPFSEESDRLLVLARREG